MENCSEPGCAGTIEDGYCNVCGAVARGGASGSASSPSARLSTTSTRTGSSRLASAPIGSKRTGTKGFTARTRKINTESARVRAARIGAGLTRVPLVPRVDPATLVLENPEVPENRRFCPSCGTAVGRARAGNPGRTEGFEVLPAFSYLHSKGLIYCDFKPDNVIQVEDSLKLIDLGGVRRGDDQDGAIFGTIGYQAPEVAELGPSEAGDIYTIARTLAVLTFDFRGYQTTYVDSLPTADEVALFKEHDSFYRLLAKATATNPDDRFQSADELREQLFGVLREVVTRTNPQARPLSTPSPLFEAPGLTATVLTWDTLPALKPDTADKMMPWLAGVSVGDPQKLLSLLADAAEQTTEVRLAGCRAALHLGDQLSAAEFIDAIFADDPWEWRALWMQGLAAFEREDWPAAVAAFNSAYGEQPGELAPKLALAVACERADQPVTAEELYDLCAQTDVNYLAPSRFGIARIRAVRGDVAGALDALALIPETDRSHLTAQREQIAVLVAQPRGIEDLGRALDVLATLTLEPEDRQQLTAEILERALDLLAGSDAPDVLIAGHPATRSAVRDSLARTYRALAALADTRKERVLLVERANRVRNRTLV